MTAYFDEYYMYYIYMIAHMGWIGLGQNFRKKICIGLDWIGLD